MIGSWLDTTGSSRASTAAPAVHYPNLQATGPEDRLAQVADILKRLKSPSIEASSALYPFQLVHLVAGPHEAASSQLLWQVNLPYVVVDFTRLGVED